MNKFIVLFLLFFSPALSHAEDVVWGDQDVTGKQNVGSGTEAYFVGGLNGEYFDFSVDGCVTLRSTGGVNDSEFTVCVDGVGSTISSDDGVIKYAGGQRSETKRIRALDSPYTVLVSDYKLFCATDTGAITLLLPAGVNETDYWFFNTGAADVTVTPNGSELIDGDNLDKVFSEGDITLSYETTEGWR